MKVSNILIQQGKYAELERMLRFFEEKGDGRKGRQIRSEQLRPKHEDSDEEEKEGDDGRE